MASPQPFAETDEPSAEGKKLNHADDVEEIHDAPPPITKDGRRPRRSEGIKSRPLSIKNASSRGGVSRGGSSRKTTIMWRSALKKGNETMVLEVAPLQIRSGRESAFEVAFATAQLILASMPGYRSHELHRCLERPGEYLLLVRWDSLEAHEQGFRRSPRYAEWKALLHPFYDPFPTVSHYVPVVPARTGHAPI